LLDKFSGYDLYLFYNIAIIYIKGKRKRNFPSGKEFPNQQWAIKTLETTMIEKKDSRKSQPE
jgi:hypothetical protein